MKITEQGTNLIITDFNALETYKIAIKIEKDGIIFYENLIKNEKNKPARKELEFLLRDEKEHLKTFSNYLYQLREKEPDNFETDDLLDYLDYGVYHPYADMPNLPDILNDAEKTLRLGVVLEEKSIKFYQACLEHVSTPEAKEALGKIIREETKHKNLFEKLLKNL